MSVPNFTAIHPIVVDTFHSKPLMEPHGGARGKVSKLYCEPCTLNTLNMLHTSVFKLYHSCFFIVLFLMDLKIRSRFYKSNLRVYINSGNTFLLNDCRFQIVVIFLSPTGLLHAQAQESLYAVGSG